MCIVYAFGYFAAWRKSVKCRLVFDDKQEKRSYTPAFKLIECLRNDKINSFVDEQEKNVQKYGKMKTEDTFAFSVHQI